MTILKDRAVLVKLTDRTWRGGGIDKETTENVRRAAKAEANVGHFWKRLVPKAALRPRFNAGAMVRAFHINQTLPWMENGVRILPVANFKEYTDGMRRLIAKAEAEDKKFLKDYPQWINEAKRTHGKLFNADSFPSVEELQRRFSISFDIIPLPNIADWRVELSDAQVKELRKEAEKKFSMVEREGVTELLSRMHELLQHAQKRLDDPEAIFRDSLVDNIKEMSALMEKLNVSGDKTVDLVRKDVAKAFKDVTPQALRDNKEARSKTAKDARAIMKKMAAYVQPAQ